MKKLILYIMMFSIFTLIGYFVLVGFSDKNAIVKSGTENSISIKSPVEERPTDFTQNAASMLGKTLIMNGTIKEAYKNKNNEVVIYMKDKNIPLMLNCTLYHSDIQLKRPIRLGETISIKGEFIELDDEMHLENCKILYRSTN